MNVTGPAFDAEVKAHVPAGSAARHWIAHCGWFKEPEQIADQVAWTVSRITAVAVVSGNGAVVQTGQFRDRARCDWSQWNLGINGSTTQPAGFGPAGLVAGSVKGIDCSECVCHGILARCGHRRLRHGGRGTDGRGQVHSDPSLGSL